MTDIDFDVFAKLYGLARVRMNRADDLLVEAIPESAAEATVTGNDGETYMLTTQKVDAGASLICNGFSASANLAEKRARASDPDQIEALLEALESENLNGQETMQFFDDNFRRETPLDEFEEDQSTAAKAARLIVSGVGALPALDQNANEMTLVAQEIIKALSAADQFGFEARVSRVLVWAMHPDTQPEWAIFVTAWVLKNVDPSLINSYSRNVLCERYPVLETL